VTSRFVPLQGCSNFRDLGGLPTIDGRSTRWKRVFRSDTLQEITDEDVKRVVGDLGLTTIIDLRTKREIENEGRGPLQHEASVRHVHLPFIGELEVRDEVPETVERDVLQDYVHMLDTAGHLIAEAVHTIATSPGPVVFHCAAGKDRTGILAAITELLVGVPREIVVGDYELTNQVLPSVLERLARLDTYTNVKTHPPAHFRCRPEVMDRFVGVLDERHGGAAGWAASVDLGDDTLASLRETLLQ
jgi:protein-tyrosine phosphatase